MGTGPRGWVTDLAVPTPHPTKPTSARRQAMDATCHYHGVPPLRRVVRYECDSSHRGGRKTQQDGGMEGSKHLSEPPIPDQPHRLAVNRCSPLSRQQPTSWGAAGVLLRALVASPGASSAPLAAKPGGELAARLGINLPAEPLTLSPSFSCCFGRLTRSPSLAQQQLSGRFIAGE